MLIEPSQCYKKVLLSIEMKQFRTENLGSKGNRRNSKKVKKHRKHLEPLFSGWSKNISCRTWVQLHETSYLVTNSLFYKLLFLQECLFSPILN